jgi:poly-gamma-glutamate synthesis protein (capsule biosynthesis protein)
MRAGRLGLATLALGLVACDGNQVHTEGRALARAVPDWSADSSSLAVPRSGASPVAGPGLGTGKPVTFAFAGDVNFESNPGAVLREDPAALFTGVSEALEADITMVNLETAVTERGEPVPKTYNFRAPPSAFPALRSVGVDVVSLANNHGMDYGEIGLLDTLDAADDPATGLPLIGAGHDSTEAYEPFRVTIRGQRISILAGSRIVDAHLIDSWTATDTQPGLAEADDPTLLLEAVRAERAQADTVVVYLHWGQEYNDCPIADQPELADQLIAAGADVIVGSHAHVPLGGGMRGGSYVAYGLGNFIFGSAHGPGLESGILHLTLTGRRVDDAEWLPAHITNGLPTMLEGDAAAAALSTWEGLRDCADLTGGTERTTREDDGA